MWNIPKKNLCTREMESLHEVRKSKQDEEMAIDNASCWKGLLELEKD